MTTTKIPRTATRDAGEYIARHESFDGGNLNGRFLTAPVNGWRINSGRLSTEWTHVLQDTPDVIYVITSYGTPIAWIVKDGQSKKIIIPDVKYSATTTQHQHAAAHALTGDSKTRTAL